ncbi:citrate lyase subunit beta-like protein [Cellulomonas chitinilytica]|uniref:Citrate lyase subunit beta-like protein n=1 Tax=Cellulomonas chitinilytica TaxID=398759 RepID=A0A919U0Y7_9CELL|nr:CoA ester lyase [Cellulomonas chitinilytica]GIG22508.1 citrate lyase subunit beta-like protein [Cellulomonas chitinilytica]
MSAFTLGPALLFCPADRPDRYAKASALADGVILDLEDAVAPPSKASARSALTSVALDPATTVVRLNPVGTPDFTADLVALRTTPYRTLMLAKTASAADVRALAEYDVVALVETAAGVANAQAIAAVPNVVALMWGADDLVASLGGTSSRFPDGRYRDVAVHARSTVLVAAGACGRAAIDAVHMDIGDVDGLRDEAIDAAACGFTATACIHPTQVDVVRQAYRPDDTSVAWARAVLAAAEGQHGVFQWEGRMVDGPVLRHAEQVLHRAER